MKSKKSNDDTSSMNVSYIKAVEYAKFKYKENFDNPDYELDVNNSIYDYMLGYMRALDDIKNK